MSSIQRIIQNKLFRYIFIGGISYLIELGALGLLSFVLSLPDVVAVAISFWVGLICSFILQKTISFKNKEHSIRRLLFQSSSYGMLVVFNYLFTLLFVSLFSPLFGVYLARTAAILITTLWNFIIYSKVIFKNKSEGNIENV